MTKLSGRDPALLRRLNVTAVLRALYDAGELTLTDLVEASAVSRPTVEKIAADLVERGLAEEVPSPPSGVGRPPKRFRFRPDAGHLAGLDVGPNKVLCLVADLRGEVVAQARADVDPGMSAAKRLSAARAVVRKAVRGRANVQALGVGTTGVVADGKVVISRRLDDWTGTDLAAGLGRGYPVLAGNDTKLAALAEHWRGAAQDVDDVVYIQLGRSISVGMLINGSIHLGHHGAAGEIGVVPYVGWEGLFDRFPADDTGEAVKLVFDAARAGNEEARGIVTEFVGHFAPSVAITVLTVDPKRVLIGGGLSAAGALLADPLREELARLCLFPVEVETSVLGDESVALGAIRLALDHVQAELFDVTP